jgi:site-specific recombinase XerD
MHPTIAEFVNRYIVYVRDTGHRHEQIVNYRRQLDHFAAWAEARGIERLDQLGIESASWYFHELDVSVDVGPRVLRERLTKLRRFLSWLHSKGHLSIDLSPSVPVIDKRGHVSAMHACTPSNLSAF